MRSLGVYSTCQWYSYMAKSIAQISQQQLDRLPYLQNINAREKMNLNDFGGNLTSLLHLS